ncbi:MAG TPA: ATP-binding protein [Bacilli bacterium]
MEHLNKEVNAQPTKEFFINMLVKDIPLMGAIQDLIDNCVDGAIKIRSNNNYEGLIIQIDFDNEKFIIDDNCGGFSTHIARNYAFRFGRPEDAPDLPHSVGRFGVGMKRALFKIGNYFTLTSRTTESYFKLNFDVELWKKKIDWTLKLDEIEEEQQSGPYGTRIEVSTLNESVAEQFVDEKFRNTLVREVRVSHEKVIEKGLAIIINEIKLAYVPTELFVSDDIKPAFYEEEINGVMMRIYAGISKTGYPKEAGWYIYCNGRLLIEANKTELTGWGEGHPLYHNIYAMFRGYVFFEASDSYLLPWNTTKNGIDHDSKVYRYSRQKMVNMMKPVTDFLKKIKDNPYGEEDNDNSEYETEMNYTEVLNNLPTQTISAMNTSVLKPQFQAPAIKIVRRPNTQRIQYNKPIEEIAMAKAALGASSLKEIGEKTFDYFYRLECKK